jgi:NitT/TauT family transport system substrate-binding protein
MRLILPTVVAMAPPPVDVAQDLPAEAVVRSAGQGARAAYQTDPSDVELEEGRVRARRRELWRCAMRHWRSRTAARNDLKDRGAYPQQTARWIGLGGIVMTLIAKLSVGLAAVTLASVASAQDLPVIRAATLEAGTLNWELQTIIQNGLDEANGFHLEAQGYADNPATRIALEGDAADIAVADWIWVARQRAEGHDYVAIPYSTAVGGLVVRSDSEYNTLEDLKGEKIGIAGGPLDKSWLILRAYTEQEYGFDLADETEQVYGAPPLIMQTALQGETAAAINFWNFLAKMQAAGMRELMSVTEAAEALGLDPNTPLLTYYMKGEWAEEHPELVQGLYTASRQAKDLLAQDDAWDGIRDMMGAKNEAEFTALQQGYRQGIPAAGPVDTVAADKMLQVMADLGGEELVGQATSVPDGLFLDVSD